MLRLRSQTKIRPWILILVCFSLMINSSRELRAESISWELSHHQSPDFSEDGRPKRTAGGASRGECRASTITSNLTALIPDTPVALTVSPAPTFWFYVPYTLTAKHSAELVLKDNQGNFVYKNRFSGKDISPGIISLSLPSTVALEINQDYDWYFLIYCDRQNPDRFVYVNGSVKRVKISVFKSQLTTANSEEKLILYKREKIWYDTLTTLAESLQTEPQNPKLREDWLNLLQSVGLEHLTDFSFNPCCSLDEMKLKI